MKANSGNFSDGFPATLMLLPENMASLIFIADFYGVKDTKDSAFTQKICLSLEGIEDISMEKMEYIDLFTLQSLIREAVGEAVPVPIWLKAEIASISVKSYGHVYLELSQSDKSGVIAKSKAAIWQSYREAVLGRFRKDTGSDLEAGVEVLIQVRVSYHSLYGMTLSIVDINPSFTLGERQIQKQQTIDRLTKEGLMDRQKKLRLAELPYYLAVISADTAAGYGDFRRHLLENEYGFAYRLDLFSAAMQGATASDSIREALDGIMDSDIAYDAVLILRGGGSELDLSCFDDYSLAAAIARFPIPVFTAIGHDRDHHVADMVANTFVKTPTALADLVIDRTAEADGKISAAANRLMVAFTGRLRTQEAMLEAHERLVVSMVRSRLDAAEAKLSFYDAKIPTSDPRRLLERGIPIVADGKGVKIDSARGRRPGDAISVHMPDGRLDCVVRRVLLGEDIDKETVKTA